MLSHGVASTRSASAPSTRSLPPSAYRSWSSRRRSRTLPVKPAAVLAPLPVLTFDTRPATLAAMGAAARLGGSAAGGGAGGEGRGAGGRGGRGGGGAGGGSAT